MTQQRNDEDEASRTTTSPGDRSAGEPGFDAVAAAAELEASLAAEDATGTSASADAYVEELEREVLELNDLVAKWQATARQAEARAENALEQIEVAKVRLDREAKRELQRRTRSLLLPFVDVLDDLDRALTSARAMDHNPDVVSGVELVQRRFETALQSFGVRRQAARGEPFDPELHEAVSVVPIPSGEGAGQIVEVLREGFVIEEEKELVVLRPAQVVVGKSA